MGLYKLTMEMMTATLNVFLQHCNMNTALGIILTATLENLQLQLRFRKCPLHCDYNTWSGLTIDSWIKSLWEKVGKFRIDVVLVYKAIPLPRENDACIMEHFVEIGIHGN